MRYIFIIFLSCFLISCAEPQKKNPFSAVEIEELYSDSVSIRAIEFLDANTLAFAGSKGVYGTLDVATHKIRTNTIKYHTSIPEFRAVGHTSADFFMLSVANPALLYKTGDNGRMQLVYIEEDEGVFYDAMTFWNDQEGIAIGDTVNGCISIIITRDGGQSWQKTPCSELPEGIASEGAFAASNTNIKTIADNTWIATTKRILFSSDKGKTWQQYSTPVLSKKTSEGIYSIDFYDENLGFAFGGDYTNPENNTANKAITTDGGKTWQLIANQQDPQYKSCVQFAPNSKGKELIAIGFTGISYSSDKGATWTQLSEESFYTLRFLNDSVAYAAGKHRIAKIVFK